MDGQGPTLAILVRSRKVKDGKAPCHSTLRLSSSPGDVFWHGASRGASLLPRAGLTALAPPVAFPACTSAAMGQLGIRRPSASGAACQTKKARVADHGGITWRHLAFPARWQTFWPCPVACGLPVCSLGANWVCEAGCSDLSCQILPYTGVNRSAAQVVDSERWFA